MRSNWQRTAGQAPFCPRRHQQVFEPAGTRADFNATVAFAARQGVRNAAAYTAAAVAALVYKRADSPAGFPTPLV